MLNNCTSWSGSIKILNNCSTSLLLDAEYGAYLQISSLSILKHKINESYLVSCVALSLCNCFQILFHLWLIWCEYSRRLCHLKPDRYSWLQFWLLKIKTKNAAPDSLMSYPYHSYHITILSRFIYCLTLSLVPVQAVHKTWALFLDLGNVECFHPATTNCLICQWVGVSLGKNNATDVVLSWRLNTWYNKRSLMFEQ